MSLDPISSGWAHDGHCLERTGVYNLHLFSKYYEWILGTIGIMNLNKALFIHPSWDLGWVQ
jgi:hypothetical protein